MSADRDRVVVTGGSGFIGTNVVDSMLVKGLQVINIDIAAPRNPAHASRWKRVDVLDEPLLRRTLVDFRPTHVYHLAARTDLDSDKLSDYQANTVGVESLISACESVASLKRVIFASSRLVCRTGYQPKSDDDYCPTTAYGESKVATERIVRKARPGSYSSVIVRPTSIWGPWFGVPYRNFFESVEARRYFHPSGLKVFKSFGYVGNAVYQLDKLMHAAMQRVERQTFYVADYRPIEVQSFADLIASAFGLHPVGTLPLTALRGLARIGDMAKLIGYKNPPLTSFRLENICTDMLYDFGDLPSITGELPYSLEIAVAKTADWMKREGK